MSHVTISRLSTGCDAQELPVILVLELDLYFSDKQLTEMKDLLQKKEEEMKAMEDRYKK